MTMTTLGPGHATEVPFTRTHTGRPSSVWSTSASRQTEVCQTVAVERCQPSGRRKGKSREIVFPAVTPDQSYSTDKDDPSTKA